jgi:UDP:flavonoid glycosyltransferase YjiC (YdhE family)
MKRTSSSITFLMLPENGHLNPTFKIARQLKARGHKVRYAGIPDIGDYIGSQGLAFVPILERSFPKGFRSRPGAGVENVTGLLKDKAASMNLTFEDFLGGELRALLKATRTDLLVIDAVLPSNALIVEAVRKLGVRHLLLSASLLGKCRFNEPENREVLMVLCPREFEYDGFGAKAEHHYVEASIDLERKGRRFAWSKLRADKPLVYCALGMLSHHFEASRNILRTVIQVAGHRRDLQMIVSIGTGFRKEDFAPVPTNVVIMEQPPQLEILKRASVMITHGGLGSIKECIYFGTPMIVLPLGRDEPENAARVVHHNLGLAADVKDISIELLDSLINRINDEPVFRAKVAAMRKIFVKRESSGRAVNIFESILKEASPRRLCS